MGSLKDLLLPFSIWGGCQNSGIVPWSKESGSQGYICKDRYKSCAPGVEGRVANSDGQAFSPGSLSLLLDFVALGTRTLPN